MCSELRLNYRLTEMICHIMLDENGSIPSGVQCNRDSIGHYSKRAKMKQNNDELPGSNLC